MRSYKILTVIFFFLFSFLKNTSGQVVDIGIFENPSGSGTLEIRVRPDVLFVGPYSNVVFTIRWLDSYGVSLLNPTSSFFIMKDGAEEVSGIYRYQKFAQATGQTINWPANQEVVVMTINKDGNGLGAATFELVNDSWTNSNNGDHYEELLGVDVTGAIYASAVSILLPVELSSFYARTLTHIAAIQI